MRHSASTSRLIALVALLIVVGIVAFGRMSTKPSMQNLNGKWYTGLIKVKQTYLFFLGEGTCLRDVFSSKIEPGII